MEANQEEHRVLMSALIHAIPDRDAGWKAYSTDPEFRALVRTLADLWCDLAPTLIEQSKERQIRIAEAIEVAKIRVFEGTLDQFDLDERWGEFYHQNVPPPEPHYIQVRRTKAPPRGRGYIMIHVEHPDSCRRQPHDGRTLGRYNCRVEEGAAPIRMELDPAIGRFRVNRIRTDGTLALTPIPPPVGHRFHVSYGSQRAFTEIIHPPTCAGPGKCPLEYASLPSPHPSEGDYGLEDVTDEGVLVLNDRRDLPLDHQTARPPMTFPTEDER